MILRFIENYNWRECEDKEYHSYQQIDRILETINTYDMDNQDLFTDFPTIYVFMYVRIIKSIFESLYKQKGKLFDSIQFSSNA